MFKFLVQIILITIVFYSCQVDKSNAIVVSYSESKFGIIDTKSNQILLENLYDFTAISSKKNVIVALNDSLLIKYKLNPFELIDTIIFSNQSRRNRITLFQEGVDCDSILQFKSEDRNYPLVSLDKESGILRTVFNDKVLHQDKIDDFKLISYAKQGIYPSNFSKDLILKKYMDYLDLESTLIYLNYGYLNPERAALLFYYCPPVLVF